MATARDIMTEGSDHLSADRSAADAAQHLADSGIGAVPICGDDGRLQGMVTDRDLVVKVIAAGKDPSSTLLGDLTDQGEVVTIGADDDVAEALRTMADHQVRRLPVIDGDQLVGIISQADVAEHCPAEQVGHLVAAISDAP